jgi:hypothetical protein
MESEAVKLDVESAASLAKALLLPILDYQKRLVEADRPPSRMTVYEVLNALAFATAMVLEGTGRDPIARQFFHLALADQLEESIE